MALWAARSVLATLRLSSSLHASSSVMGKAPRNRCMLQHNMTSWGQLTGCRTWHCVLLSLNVTLFHASVKGKPQAVRMSEAGISHVYMLTSHTARIKR